mmetsp:Transcript_51402/g.95047  ORF Transcript_51402/g.95047 Transcript_51402/m.95047 type:complete len:81 (+) Transcript_51402:68-310(+)
MNPPLAAELNWTKWRATGMHGHTWCHRSSRDPLTVEDISPARRAPSHRLQQVLQSFAASVAKVAKQAVSQVLLTIEARQH